MSQDVAQSQDFNMRASDDEPVVVSVRNVMPMSGPRLTEDLNARFGKSASEAVDLKDMLIDSPQRDSVDDGCRI